ncbi:MAG TPA: endolytic transglycosylase MltG [Alphaproteobacteria bacterium]
MKKTLIAFFILCLPMVVAFAGISWWVDKQLHSPANFVVGQTFIVPKGATGMAIARQLREAQIIKHDWLFYSAVRWPFYPSGPATIKAGEYSIPAKASLWQVFDLLRSGKTVVHSFTLPEGLTVKQAVALLNQQELLTGDTGLLPPEGSILPETYNFERDEARLAIIKRMQNAMTKVTDSLWDGRDPNLPFTTLKEALTLASIVEKETSLPSERARVAGVYINRLRIGMPLQADPTVVYAVTDGLGHMQGKRLWGKYLEMDSPYNTYKNAGLPPTPIANPGKASIEATLHPEQNEYLYFVADGKGGHIFARTLAEHEKNARQWHQLRRDRDRVSKAKKLKK